MALGDSQIWTDHFVSADERILERIAAVWPACLSRLNPQPIEDTITINLVDLLNKDPMVRRICHWIEYQFEPFGIDGDGIKYSKGKIDIAVLLDWNRERYIAYECKRLNVVHNGKRSSLATAYVEEGMMRFMSGQYAETLPIGCMLGYVIDGDVPYAINKLTKAIVTHQPLCLTNDPEKVASVKKIKRFYTDHDRPSSTTIQLRHALLPFS